MGSARRVHALNGSGKLMRSGAIMSMLRRVTFLLAAAALAFSAQGAEAKSSFSAELTGAAHLPEPVVTKATGFVTVTISDDGSSLKYTVTVQNLSNIVAADLHMGPDSANGPLVARLFPTGGAKSKKGPFSGTLAEGTIRASDLIGPLLGASLADLIEEIRAGNAYVNIHTNDGVDPPDTGPGDYTLGEIRGQLQ
jgi:hypothetical protein